MKQEKAAPSQAYGAFGIADFNHSEHERRVEKAQRLMRKRRIDCLILSNESNIGYFSGYRGTAGVESVDYSTAFLVLPSDEDPVLVTYVTSRGNVESMLAVGRADYVGWEGLETLSSQKYTRNLVEGVARAAGQTKGRRLTVGMEIGGGMHVGASQELITSLRSHIPRARFVDGSEVVWNCRKIKSQAEVKYLKEACRLTGLAYTGAFEKVREGMTEREVAREIYKGVLDGGGEDMPLKMFLNLRAGPERYAMCDTRPTDRPLRHGDILIVDGGIKYRGYFSDLTRILSVGRPSPKQRELFDAALGAEEVGIRMLESGAIVKDIWDAVIGWIRKSGQIKYNLFEGIGHGIGLDIHEPPRIRRNGPDRLEPGMVLTMEPCLYDAPVVREILAGGKRAGKGVFFVEDEILVREDGNELLSEMPRSLYVA